MEESLAIEAAAGIRLAGTLHLPRALPRAGVVICHGMLSTKDSPKHVSMANGLCDRGHAVLRFDFQGRGQSSGDLRRLTFSRQVDECRAALHALRRRTAVERVGLIGSSMGGAVALLTASEAAVAGLVTLAAVGRTDLLAERLVGEKAVAVWERKGFLRLESEPVGWALVLDARRLDLLAAAGRIDCPWLILHPERDEVVPVSDARALHRAAGGNAELDIVAEADHRFSRPAHLRYASRRAVDFLHAALSSPSRRQ